MTNQTASTSNSDIDPELPVFPATAPEALTDPTTAIALIEPVLDRLSRAVDVPIDLLDRPTPCRDYTVEELRNHVLAWLQFFADALDDWPGAGDRVDPEQWVLTESGDPAAIVTGARRRIVAAISSDVGRRLVTMSQARMRGDAVVAMALGEYIVHGWDLSVSTSRGWTVDDDAAEQALLFLEGTVTPEYRGEASGFFGDQVVVADDAPALERLLGFAGRDPGWTPPPRT